MSTTKNNLEDFDSDEWGNTNLPGLSDKELVNPKINIKIANKIKGRNPEYQEKIRKTVTEQWASDDQSKRIDSVSKGITKLWEDTDYIATQKLGRAARYANPERCGNYKGPVIGICKKTGKKIILIGIQQMKEAGFEPGNVYACIAGTRKSSGGYTWARS
jgi:hypothetical protein